MSLFSRKREVADTAELKRIRAIPRRFWTEEELQDLASDMTKVLRTPNGRMSLRPIQALALREIGVEGGLFGPIRVGGGKTLVSLLAPEVLESELPLLLLPASLIEKTERERRELSTHWRIPTNMPILSYEGMGRAQNATKLDYFRPDLLVLDEAHRVKNHKAGVSRRVARYMRENPKTRMVAISGTMMKSSIEDFGKILRWCLKDNAPVPAHEGELKEWADALDVEQENDNFMRSIEPGSLLTLCNEEEREHSDLKAARLGFQRRLLDTAGVVSTGGDQVSCSLYINALEVEVSQATEANFQTLRTTWETPDGWPLSEAVAVWRHARELALGFHYLWWNERGYQECLTKILQNKGQSISPIERKILIDCERMTGSGADLVKALGTLKNSNDQAGSTGYPQGTVSTLRSGSGSFLSTMAGATSADARGERSVYTLTTTIQQEGLGAFFASCAIDRSDAWVTLLKAFPGLLPILEEATKAARPPDSWMVPRCLWARFVRGVLQHSRKLDTELQVAIECRENRLPRQEYDAWMAVKDTFKPNPKAIWHDDSALEACEKWMKKNVGIVWCEHTFFAEELSKRTGVPYYGKQGADRYGNPIESADRTKPVIASVAANSTGRNLQFFSKNLITSCLTGADGWEQLLGRTHRDGQLADEVTCDVLLSCFEHFKGWQTALAQAEQAADTLGQPQKLLLADKDFPTEMEMLLRGGFRWSKAMPSEE